jgi:hypothetical protein
MKIFPVEAEMFHSVGRTNERRDKTKFIMRLKMRMYALNGTRPLE